MLTVIVPSRGRPDNVKRLLKTFEGQNAKMVLVTDPTDTGYEKLDGSRLYRAYISNPPPGVVAPLNHGASPSTAPPISNKIGFMGDDHLPESPNWCKIIEDELEHMRWKYGAGIVYGDDGLMGALLPTAVFMTFNIVNALGWMAPPVLRHLYCDNFWKDLGTELGIIRYLPHLKITHLHPHADVGVNWDETYERGNVPHVARDHDYYYAYKTHDFPSDVEKVRKLLRK